MTSLLTDIRVTKVDLVLQPAIKRRFTLFKGERDDLERVNLWTAPIEKSHFTDEQLKRIREIKARLKRFKNQIPVQARARLLENPIFQRLLEELADVMKGMNATDDAIREVLKAVIHQTSEEVQTTRGVEPVDNIRKAETLLFNDRQLTELQKSARSMSVSKSDDGELTLTQEASFQDNSDADRMMANDPTLSRVQALAQVRGTGVGKARTALALNALLGPMPKTKAIRKADADYSDWLEKVLHIAEHGW